MLSLVEAKPYYFTPIIENYVSLTYLRGLEVAELKEEDMPMVSLFHIARKYSLISNISSHRTN